MRTCLSIAILFSAVAAQAEPAKGGEKKGEAKPAARAPLNLPPLPPQLDNTLWADPASAKWEPVASLPKGAQGALIGTDASDGGMAGWLKFPAGYRVPPSWDTHRSSYTVISGQLTITSGGQKHVFGPGGYIVLNSKDRHDLACGPAECLLVVRHFGPPDMHWVNPADAPRPAKSN